MKRFIKILLTLLITIIIVLGFAMPLNPPNGTWYQQFLPNIGSRTIQDIYFLDSLTGWSVTNATNQGTDTTFILKTTNSGYNWVMQYRKIQTGGGFSGYFKVYFLNQNTGYTCDVKGIYKTTDGGNNWVSLNAPLNAYLDMRILNTDTIWIVTPDSFAGGVFFTSNGGANWQNQFSGGNQNPDKIYMYNARIGFMSNSSALPNIYKTTNGGANWVVNVSGQYIRDMFFIDSLTGWYSHGTGVYKTTNGGINWVTQILPTGGIIITTGIDEFSALNKDTLLGVGGTVFYGAGQFRGMIFKTVNGGQNWLFQVPDTTIHIPAYKFIQFINLRNGWAYSTGLGGIHTTNGGDTTFLTGVQQVSSEVPNNFKLYQNYPNPFNPKTVIKYKIVKNNSAVQLEVYDLTGKYVNSLVNHTQNAGTYEVDFNGNNNSSGIYFYKLTVTTGKEVFTKTRKMILLK